MRLIDADLAKQKIITLEHEPDYQHEGEDWSVGLCMAESVLDEIPTSNIAEQIFSEIESLLNEWIRLYYNISVSTFDSIESAKAIASESTLRAFNDYITELKKKYGVK